MFGKLTKSDSSTVPVRPTEKSVVLRSPGDEIVHIRRQMDDLIHRLFGPAGYGVSWPQSAGILDSEPAVDIYDAGTAIKLFAELPGYSADQISIESTGDTIRISGERKALYDNDKARVCQRSGATSAARFQIEGTLPGEVDPKRVTATFANGVLQVEMPKTAETTVSPVKVPITA